MIFESFENKADRAKQFAPFDALRGFREALEQKERIVVKKIDLSDEMKEDIDLKLHQISLNDIITVIYFCDGEYLKVTGMVSGFFPTSRILQIVNTKIYFDDIYDIQTDFDYYL